ncbi:PTS lactose/cellobiose transporter subunit IIA [Listeria valentina]|uniref:PTS lactose/cellobiose transporter subunit IIA n=1 Tax=Listeria valentina TaxID=2705293 RepID=UPI00142FAA49|nr:PTS lactose/cellobiose transporter subunit IIA [Listeria valentina]
MEKVKKEELNLLSMEVILHAGNARDFVFKAIEQAANGDFAEADSLMERANEEIHQAHREQTSTLQKEAEGIEIPYSPLFGHAQDTLMTVKTEFNLIREFIKLYKKSSER